MYLALPVTMAGCATSTDLPHHAQMASRPCTAVAQARMTDAAENGIEPAMQEIIFRDSYNECVHWQDKAVMHTTPR